MKNVANYVEDIVKRSPFIAEAIRDGLLNTSSYARTIIPEIEKNLGKEVKVTTVVMAIQRMNFGNILHESKKLKNLLRKLKDILVRGHLNVYTLKQSPTLPKNVALLLTKIGTRNDAMCTFTQGIAESTIIISEAEVAKFEQIFAKETIIETESNLTAFTLLLPEDNRTLSGVYYYILKQVAWYGINVIEVVSTSNEFTILVEEKHSSICFDVLRKMGNIS